MDMVCAIKGLSLQFNPVDANILRQESGPEHYSDALCARRVVIDGH